MYVLHLQLQKRCLSKLRRSEGCSVVISTTRCTSHVATTRFNAYTTHLFPEQQIILRVWDYITNKNIFGTKEQQQEHQELKF